jgi:hypothetical protein
MSLCFNALRVTLTTLRCVENLKPRLREHKRALFVTRPHLRRYSAKETQGQTGCYLEDTIFRKIIRQANESADEVLNASASHLLSVPKNLPSKVIPMAYWAEFNDQ